MVPRQTAPVARRSARNTKWSVPALLDSRRCTVKEPLAPRVVLEPFAEVLPLCLIVQSQTWPAWLLSTSASSWIRPLSGCAFIFHTAGPPQPPWVRTAPDLAWLAVAGAMAASGRARVERVRAAIAVRVFMMVLLESGGLLSHGGCGRHHQHLRAGVGVAIARSY